MDTTNSATETTLFCTEGSSDKVYVATLTAAAPEGTWIVNVQYGRRGSTLTCLTKTPTPVDYEKAKKIYEKLINEKLCKGYHEANGTATAMSSTDNNRVDSGIRPQLLNPVDDDNLQALLNDPDWIAQEKHDGERRMLVKLPGQALRGTNRKGQFVPIPAQWDEALAALGESFVIDGEALGDKFAWFDALSINGESLVDLWFSQRHQRIVDAGINNDVIIVSNIAASSEAKRALLAQVKASGGEGVVLRRARAIYTPNRPNSGGDALKFKLYESATCLVTAINNQRSVALSLRTTDGNDIAVGNVTIPANHAIPAVGACVEVRYLYMYEGGSLFQPTYLGARGDITTDECSLAQVTRFAPKQPA